MLLAGTYVTQTCRLQVPILHVGTWTCGEYLWVHKYLTCGFGYLVPDTCTDPGMGFSFQLTHRYRSRLPTNQLMLSLMQQLQFAHAIFSIMPKV